MSEAGGDTNYVILFHMLLCRKLNWSSLSSTFSPAETVLPTTTSNCMMGRMTQRQGWARTVEPDGRDTNIPAQIPCLCLSNLTPWRQAMASR